jgi:hypothetical protein
MGDTLGVQVEIQKISETTPNILDAKGILIATFSSLAEPSELTDWFIENKRSFLVFDLDKENSGFNITQKEVHNGLFGFLNQIDIHGLTKEFHNSLEYSSKTNTNKINLVKKPTKETLIEKLNEALRVEDYEEAAKIRDILNKKK